MNPAWIRIGITVAVAALAGLWVYRDSRARDSNPLLWVMAVGASALMLLHPLPPLVALAIYLVARPRGKMLVCPHCKRSYLDYLAFCPHCRKPVKKECHKCHENMELDAVECPYCHVRAL